ncbi:13615_t:CDS:2, partial [Racocetra fulgida]
KIEDINETVMKMAKINRQSAKISIRVSSALNQMNIEYAKKKGLTWKRLSKETITGCISEVIGCVSSVEVDVDDLDGEMVNVVVRSDLKEPTVDEKVIDEGCVAKRNNNQRESELVDVRCVKGELMENDGIDEEKKKGRIVNGIVVNLVSEENQWSRNLRMMITIALVERIILDVVIKLEMMLVDMDRVDEINEVNSYCGDGSNVEIHDRTIRVGYCYQDDATVVMEAPLNVVMRIDLMMKGLLEFNNEPCQTDNEKFGYSPKANSEVTLNIESTDERPTDKVAEIGWIM